MGNTVFVSTYEYVHVFMNLWVLLLFGINISEVKEEKVPRWAGDFPRNFYFISSLLTNQVGQFSIHYFFVSYMHMARKIQCRYLWTLFSLLFFLSFFLSFSPFLFSLIPLLFLNPSLLSSVAHSTSPHIFYCCSGLNSKMAHKRIISNLLVLLWLFFLLFIYFLSVFISLTFIFHPLPPLFLSSFFSHFHVLYLLFFIIVRTRITTWRTVE